MEFSVRDSCRKKETRNFQKSFMDLQGSKTEASLGFVHEVGAKGSFFCSANSRC